MVSDVAAFLRARLAEDEADIYDRDEPESWCDRADGVHIGHARARREVAAKRAIAELHYGPDACMACATWDSPPRGYERPLGSRFDIMGYCVPWPCPTLRALAAVYSDHPDYDPGWAP